MSLLLEALKKAEKAKEEAQRRASEGATGELQLADATQPQAAAAAPAQPVLTRAELPDISAPLEILPEDLAGSAPATPGSGSGLTLETPPQPRTAGAAPRRAAAADPQPAQRATARKVFEAKVREPNPRLPFFIIMGTLGAFAVGTAIYFYIQLRPPAPLVNLNPKPSAEVANAPAPAAPPVPSGQQPQAAASASAIPGLPSAAAPAAPAPAAAPKPAPRAAPAAPAPRAATPAIPRDVAPPRIAVQQRAPAAARDTAPRAAETSPPPAATRPAQVHPRVAAGYAAYQQGRFEMARNEYQLALREEPGNRDALLGLAALDMREQRYESADAAYRQVLRADPRDPYAHAGLMALRGQGIDPVTAESRLKTLLVTEPDSAVLHFALGNQYAQQARWPEAQQAYFKAVVAEPENPDYAYNLAVSLEHMRQTGPALDYYRRALALSEGRGASFDRAAAQARVQQLAR
jgi:tetratricopeptide (TPR) repeat protein